MVVSGAVLNSAGLVARHRHTSLYLRGREVFSEYFLWDRIYRTINTSFNETLSQQLGSGYELETGLRG